MPSEVTVGYGASLEYSTDDGTTYNDVGQTMDLPLLSSETGVIAFFNNDSGGVEEYKAGKTTLNSYEFELHFAKAVYAALHALRKAKTVAKWRVSDADGNTDEFDGFVTAIGAESETDDGLWTANVSIQPTTDDTFTAVS